MSFGVSLSIKQCRNFGINSEDCLSWLISDCGFKRFRLMSYWDEIEAVKGKFNFKELDRQVNIISQASGTINLCLGVRQPRWPENHWPDWAWKLSKDERTASLLKFLEVVVKRYKKYDVIESYQLENEALLKSFGLRAEVNRKRLNQEFELVKMLDSATPIIMTTSTSWGIPFRKPIPDIIGFSYYQTVFNSKRQRYTKAFHKVWLQKLKALSIKTFWQRPCFIHELQLEPWGSGNIWELSQAEQNKSMSLAQIRLNIQLARQTNLDPIDLWGSEWWYWQYKVRNNSAVIRAVLDEIELL